MLGVGLVGDLKEPYFSIVEKINNLKNKTIIAVDIPTGFGTKTIVKPDYTVTFHDIKKDMKENNCGKIKTVSIGVPQKALDYIGPGELSVYYPIPKKESHKGDNGRILVVGGGPYIGAPALTGLAALRTGVDLVYIATPKKTCKSNNILCPVLC
jgi:NAD(P)H-hydrate epimerase